MGHMVDFYPPVSGDGIQGPGWLGWEDLLIGWPHIIEREIMNQSWGDNGINSSNITWNKGRAGQRRRIF